MIPCQECHVRPAVIHFQSVVNGLAVMKALCPPCAQRLAPGLQLNFPLPVLPHPGPLPGSLVLQAPQLPAALRAAPAGPTRCLRCGYPYPQFQQTGLLGCPSCYESFAPQMQVVLRHSQGGGLQHHGKVPGRRGGRQSMFQEIERLRGEMQAAARDERFEEAAALRDRIRLVQARLQEASASDAPPPELPPPEPPVSGEIS